MYPHFELKKLDQSFGWEINKTSNLTLNKVLLDLEWSCVELIVLVELREILNEVELDQCELKLSDFEWTDFEFRKNVNYKVVIWILR